MASQEFLSKDNLAPDGVSITHLLVLGSMSGDLGRSSVAGTALQAAGPIRQWRGRVMRLGHNGLMPSRLSHSASEHWRSSGQPINTSVHRHGA
jgi:hypothetical protein